MERTLSPRRVVRVLVVIVLLGGISVSYAQTEGMERRDDRRDDRAEGRAAKQACKAGDEKTRAECRQEKRDVKHGGGTAAATPKPAPTKNPAN